MALPELLIAKQIAHALVAGVSGFQVFVVVMFIEGANTKVHVNRYSRDPEILETRADQFYRVLRVRAGPVSRDLVRHHFVRRHHVEDVEAFHRRPHERAVRLARLVQMSPGTRHFAVGMLEMEDVAMTEGGYVRRAEASEIRKGGGGLNFDDFAEGRGDDAGSSIGVAFESVAGQQVNSPLWLVDFEIEWVSLYRPGFSALTVDRHLVLSRG